MTSNHTKSNRLSPRLETRQPILYNINSYTPNEASQIVGMWGEYSVRMQELVNRAINDINDTKNSHSRRIFEAAISLYNTTIENHYSRIGRPNPNKIELALISQMSPAELILTHMRLRSTVDFLFRYLLAETNYKETGIISWNTVYLARDVSLGRSDIIEQSNHH
jgi:hypothetical protein